MKIMSLTMLGVFVISLLAVSANATFSHKCTETDSGIDPFDPGRTNWLPDTCKRSVEWCSKSETESLKEFYCDDNKVRVKEINCANFGAVCVADQSGPDYCACPEGKVFNSDTKTCEVEVPEFNTVAAGVAITGAGAAFLFLRSRKN